MRADYFGGARRWSLQPRPNARFAVSDVVTTKAGIGAFAQDPTDDELNPDFGNPDLGVETALHASVGAEYRPLSEIVLEATLFYRGIRDLVSRTDAVRTDVAGAIVPVRLDNGGRGRAYGAEVLLRHELRDGFSGWLAYTLSRSLELSYGGKGVDTRERRAFRVGRVT